MNVDRNIKVLDLILSTLLLSETGTGLKRFFASQAQFLNFMTLKMGFALHISLHLANHKSQRSDFGAVCKASNGSSRFHCRWLIFIYEKEGTTILERVAFILRVSIYHLHARDAAK